MARNNLTNQAYHEIKRKILDNKWYPGYSILLPQIAEELNMSRTPVREALIKLEHEGLIRIFPRRGVIVEPLRMKDIIEIYDLMEILEGLEARLLAKQVKKNHSLTKEMEKIIIEGKAFVDKNNLDINEWAEYDIRFHNFLRNRCGNQRLKSLGELINDQVYRARMITLKIRPFPINSINEHNEIYKAIKNGDEYNAEIMARKHRLNGKKMVIEAIDRINLVNI